MMGRNILVHLQESASTASGRTYVYGAIYVVDTEADVVSKFSEGRLLNDSMLTSMVISGSSIYILGGRPPCDHELAELLNKKEDHVHFKTSCLDLENRGNGWKTGPPSKSCLPMPDCVSLDGKIYSFRGKESFGEVFDPNRGEWDALSQPTQLVMHSSVNIDVSSPLIPDPSMNRIIVHLRNMSSLYAYYPDQGTWDCLVQGSFWIWSKLAAIVDNVIYFHFPKRTCPFLGYDLGSKNWIQVVLSSDYDMDLISSKFDALFNLGHGNLCLATYSPDFKSQTTYLIFVKFRFERACSEDALATLLFAKKFPLDFRCRALHYAPLLGELSRLHEENNLLKQYLEARKGITQGVNNQSTSRPHHRNGVQGNPRSPVISLQKSTISRQDSFDNGGSQAVQSGKELEILLEEKNRALVSLQAGYESEVKQLQKQLENERAISADLELKFQGEQKRKGSSQEEIIDLKSENNKIVAMVQELQQTLKMKTSEIGRLEEELKKRNNDELDKSLSDLRMKVACLEEENGKLKIEKERLKASLELRVNGNGENAGSDNIEIEYAKALSNLKKEKEELKVFSHQET